MRKRYIDVDGYWGIVFCYDYDFFDIDEMGAIMNSFGLSEKDISEALRILYGVNTGMTISRNDIRMSVVFVSESSSLEQFMDTCTHELDHVQSSILEYYEIAQGGEDGAWLQGYMMRKLTKILERDGVIKKGSK